MSPQRTAWFYANVKADLWTATGSGARTAAPASSAELVIKEPLPSMPVTF
jgi:hypothetical protein